MKKLAEERVLGSGVPFLKNFSPTNLFLTKTIRKNLAAFTLAEVLITLAVIGVVAALTLPIVVGKYQKKILVGQLKRNYAVMNTTMQRIFVDDGCEKLECSFLDLNDPDYVLQKFKKFMFISDPDTKGGDLQNIAKKINSNEFISVNNGFTEFILSFRLNDGSKWYYGGGYGSGFILAVDVNGDKNPNKVGRDFFQMFVNSKGVAEPMLGRGWIKELCSMATCEEGYEEEWLQQLNEACVANTDSGDIMGPCFSRIISDNWEMKY